MKNGHNVWTANANFPLFYYFSFISIPKVKLIPQFINVIATNNDLLMDELNVIYFALKLWLHVMIWLPGTTDNSTHFAQSLEIRGIESRLYIISLNKNNNNNNKILAMDYCLEYFFMPPKELWEAYSNRTVSPSGHQSVHPAFVSGPYLLYSLI